MNLEDIIAFNKENVYCDQSPKSYGLTHFARRNFECGTVLIKGFGKLIDHQTTHFSIQIGFGKHFIPQKWTGKYWNHSCEPNTFIMTRPDGFPNLVAHRDIREHEEITYAYYMTEYEWSKGAKENLVKCLCGAKNCMGQIKAFSQLTMTEQLDLERKGQLSQYLAELVRKNLAK
jgi:hypothetical protein